MVLRSEHVQPYTQHALDRQRRSNTKRKGKTPKNVMVKIAEYRSYILRDILGTYSKRNARSYMSHVTWTSHLFWTIIAARNPI